ncbi:MAG: penicillin-binding protein [Mycobacteriaceae bacterium]|nr:penicillin-binding protein [Mycobacteriaceae bacterium]
MTWRSHRNRTRIALLVIAVAALSISVESCNSANRAKEEPRDVVNQFVEALDSGSIGTAASLTSYPNGADTEMRRLFDGMRPGTATFDVTQFIPLDPAKAFFTMKVDWHLGAGADWDYRVQGTVRKLGTGWRVSWDPSVLMPGLGHSRTARLVRVPAKPQLVLDVHDKPLMQEYEVYDVRLDPKAARNPAAAAAALAAAIAPVAPAITEQRLLNELATARGASISAVRLRERDYESLKPKPQTIPGVTAVKRPRLLPVRKEIHSPVLDGLNEVWQHNRETAGGWMVQVVNTTGAVVQEPAVFPGMPTPPVKSTLDSAMQAAAQAAVEVAATPAEVVVLRPSNGAVVAVAQNDAADRQGPLALNGLYSAGGALDLFAGGAAGAKKVRLQDVATRELMTTINNLGIGVDLAIPGVHGITGAIPGMHLSEPIRMIAGGTGVQVTPFGMALAAATIERGTVPMPMISYWRPGSPDKPIGKIAPAVLDQLRAVMRESSAKDLGGSGIQGYAATAGDDQWFLGRRGDLAFAVHISHADVPGRAKSAALRLLGGA